MNGLKRFCMKVWVPVYPTEENSNGKMVSLLLARYYEACAKSTVIKYVRVWHQLCGKYARKLFKANVATYDHGCVDVDPKAEERAMEEMYKTYRPPGFGQPMPWAKQIEEMYNHPTVIEYLETEKQKKK